MQWQKVKKKFKQFGQFDLSHALTPVILAQKSLESVNLPLSEVYGFDARVMVTGPPQAIRAFFHHHHILDWMCGCAGRPLVKEDLLTLAALLGITPLAWRAHDMDAKVAKGTEVCHLLDQFCAWLEETPDEAPELAAESAHALMFIHPFSEKMDLFVRWALSLILIHRGYPPPLLDVSVSFAREAVTKAVIKGLDAALSLQPPPPASPDGEPKKPVNLARKRSTLKAAASKKADDALKIGTMAKRVGETVPTLRYWTKEGILNVSRVTESGYHLYGPEALARIEHIQEMKRQRLTLREIKDALAEMPKAQTRQVRRST